MSSLTSLGFHDPRAFSIVTFWLQQSTGVRPSLSLHKSVRCEVEEREARARRVVARVIVEVVVIIIIIITTSTTSTTSTTAAAPIVAVSP